MKIVAFVFKTISVASLLSILLFYLGYFVIDLRSFKYSEVVFYKLYSPYCFSVSLYCIMGSVMLMHILIYDKFRIGKIYHWLVVASIISWIVVFLINPGNIFTWVLG